MKILHQQTLNFQRKLKSNEEADFYATLNKSKEKLGNIGRTSLIIPSKSLPQEYNTGMGNFLDKEGIKFIDFAKQYWGINAVQVLPEGHYANRGGEIFLPYSGSSFALGEHLINLEALTKDEYGKLLTEGELKNILSKTEDRVDFENVLLKDSPVDKALRKAYNELLKSDTKEKKELLEKVSQYAKENKEWLEPKAIFQFLSEKYNSIDYYSWNDFDKNFYNEDVITIEKRNSAIKDMRNSQNSKELGFVEFKQYLAEDNLFKARKMLNERGIKLDGDMLIGFSYDEVWANPKAFVENSSLKWKLPALNFDNVEAENLLRNKVNKFARRYDGIRIDAAWTYVSQPIKNKITGKNIKKEYGTKFIDLIENEIIKVKGANYDLENIMYEFLTDPNEFNIFDGYTIKDFLKDKTKIITSYNCSENWGTVSAFKTRGWKDGAYILGATNHDSKPLKLEFQGLSNESKQISTLSNIFKIPVDKLNNDKDFKQIKMAEPLKSKHNMLFFTEALNISERYKDNQNRVDDYRIKIDKDYQKKYFDSLQKNEGFNIMDALEKTFIAEGLDKKEPKLYKKIKKYNKILKAPESNNKIVKISITLISLTLMLTFGIKYLMNKNNK